MEDLFVQLRAKRLDTALRYLAALLVTIGVSVLTVVLFLANREVPELFSGEILIPGDAVMGIAVALLLLTVASGLISLYRVRYGWLAVFFVASLVLLIGLLMGTRTVFPGLASFLVMMILSLLLWADAVVYYLWDLYT
jgi:hypothetical protein